MDFCYTCQIYLKIDDLFWDGSFCYCFNCIESKKIDDQTAFQEEVNWTYCDNCQNIIVSDYHIGPCHLQINCMDSKIHLKPYSGYNHLCKECGKEYMIDHKQIISCLLCVNELNNLN